MSCHKAIALITGRAICFDYLVYCIHSILQYLSIACLTNHLWPIKCFEKNSLLTGNHLRYSLLSVSPLIDPPGTYKILKLTDVVLIEEQRLKEESLYFQVRGIIFVELKSLPFSIFQITIIMTHSLKYSRTTAYFHYFIVCALIPYKFNLVTVRL